jgi:NAD(P)-dependent dehydrogenase (short-subunit alcohol dehydrogenase family)
MVADVRGEGAEETAALIKRAGGQAAAVAVDIGKSSDVTAMVAATVKAFGRIDCAFNNAGLNGTQAGAVGKLTAEWPEEAFDRVIQVNLKGTWLCMRAEIEQMLRQGSGSIVNTASLAGLTGFRTTAGYAASKHAIVGMSKTAAIEYAPKIRVNCICPGWVDSDMVRDTITRRGPEVLARVPVGRVASPKELGEMVCWLASDRASYATGATFTVDGGHMAN